jgi:hypothetical protein
VGFGIFRRGTKGTPGSELRSTSGYLLDFSSRQLAVAVGSSRFKVQGSRFKVQGSRFNKVEIISLCRKAFF